MTESKAGQQLTHQRRMLLPQVTQAFHLPYLSRGQLSSSFPK